MSILLNVLLVFYVIVTVLMILIILMQRPKSEGLGAAFGGGVTDNLFGAQTSNVLTKVTGWLAGTFFFLTFALSVAYAHRSGGSGALRQELMKTAPVTATSPAPGASVAPAAPVDAQQAVAAPAGDQVPPAAVQGNSPTGADLAVGAVDPVPPPGNTVAPNASVSPGKP
ncbi:MAG: preprotein translocase subunit SecG [Chthoniobacterales bacterium]